jgi:hypothetical protein
MVNLDGQRSSIVLSTSGDGRILPLGAGYLSNQKLLSSLHTEQKELEELADGIKERGDAEQQAISHALLLVTSSMPLVISVREQREAFAASAESGASAASDKAATTFIWLQFLQLITWPYVLAVAFALRLTKVCRRTHDRHPSWHL